MKILTAKEMRAADQATFATLGIPSRAVMESAGRHLFAFLLERCPEGAARGTIVVTGSGNNGGDGFVIARALLNHGLPVTVCALSPVADLRGDAGDAARAFLACGPDASLIEGVIRDGVCDVALLREIFFRVRPGVIVDALFGTGIRGPVVGPLGEVIGIINELSVSSAVPILAVDLPSGIPSDSGDDFRESGSGESIQATWTVAIQALKPAHLLFPAAHRCGELFVADIGIAEMLPGYHSVKRTVLTAADGSRLVRTTPLFRPESHKGTRGHVVVVAGGKGKYGAAKLAALAAYRAGAGLVTLATPASAARAIAPELLELMCAELADDDGNIGAMSAEIADRLLAQKTVLLLGPGCGNGEGFRASLPPLLNSAAGRSMPVVIDADGLNVLGEVVLPPNTVLTPHPGELGRLLGVSTAEVQRDRFGSACAAAAKFRATIVLKGAHPIIAGPDGDVAVFPLAHPVLGTGGSGDVLGGVLAAFLGAQMPFDDAVSLGVMVHGLAAYLLESERGGRFGVLAGDIAAAVPVVCNRLAHFRAPVVRAVVEPVFPGRFPEIFAAVDNGAHVV